MSKRILAAILVSAMFMVLVPATAFAVTTNGFGRTYAAPADPTAGCGCHDSTGGGQVLMSPNAHTEMVTNIPATPAALVPDPVALPGQWPSPTTGSGLRFDPGNVLFMLGGTGFNKEYVGLKGSAMPAGSSAATVPGVSPADDVPLFDPIGYDVTTNKWELEGTAVGTAAYFQRCGSCHNLGVTKPNSASLATTVSLPVTGSVGPSTATTTAAQLTSIQCENCHGSGNVGDNLPASNHQGSGAKMVGYLNSPGSVTPRRILQSYVCGQCHAKGSALASDGATIKQYGSTTSAFSAPLGFTTNNPIFGFFQPATVVPTAGPDANFYPTGANKGMKHGFYNEWLNNVAPETNVRLVGWDAGTSVPGSPITTGPASSITTLAAGRGHRNSWVAQRPTNGVGGTNAKCMRCHSGDGRLWYIGTPTGSGGLGLGANAVSNSSFTETDFAGTNPTSTPIAGIECAVCHTSHSSTNPTTAPSGLGMRAGAACADCHNWQYEVLEAQVPVPSAIATGISVGSRGPSHPQREMNAGTGLIGVADSGQFMPGTECKSCHMPRTSDWAAPSHRFQIMLPGDADTWSVPAGGDSCTPCHPSSPRLTLQDAIDAWQADVALETTNAINAATAAGARGYAAGVFTTSSVSALVTSNSTTGAVQALKAAFFDYRYVVNDGSTGVHNVPYARAGLAKSQWFSNAIEATFTAASVPGSTARSGDKVSIYGGLPALGAGNTIVVEKSTDGGGLWSSVGTGTTDADGGYSINAGTLSATSAYRAKMLVINSYNIYSNTTTVTLAVGGNVPVNRIAGATRYQTAVNTSKSQFATGTVQNIVIAGGENFPDALSAAGVAGTVGSPVLLAPSSTTGGNNPASMAALNAEINRIKSVSPTATLWFVGGTGVVPTSVRNAIQAATSTNVNNTLQGVNRYATSQACANLVASLQGGSFSHQAFVVSGETFQDALSVGPVAYAQKRPVILTLPSSLLSQTSSAITANNIATITVVGGTSNVNPGVIASIQGLAGVTSATRPAGSSTDPYQRSADFATWALANVPGTSAGLIGIASGANFPDGLGCSAAVGTNNGLVLLTDPAALSAGDATFLTTNKASISRVTIYGGTGAVSGNVFESVVAIVNPSIVAAQRRFLK
jgi:predicted CXXCH cytochrome family protein